MLRRVAIIASLLLILGCAAKSVQRVKMTKPSLLPNPAVDGQLRLLLNRGRPLIYEKRGKMVPTAIVLHSTSGKKFLEATTEMTKNGQSIHILIDSNAIAYQLTESLEDKCNAVKGMDDCAIEVAVVGGIGEDILINRNQLAKVVKLVKIVAERYGINLDNFDIENRKGIFSHKQAKYKFGGVLANDNMEPGEAFAKVVIEGAGGRYYEESEWKGRYTDTWHFVAENPENLAKRGEFTRGRGITPTPKAALPSLAHTKDGYAIEDKRLQYVYSGNIKVMGIVLHFTATDDFETAQESIEMRRLCSTIIVDADGSAYQVLDSLEDKAIAAGGTNDQCIQIEIVGMGEEDLVKNKRQKLKVEEVVSAICKRYNIPKSNFDIESRKGIFSHGQAKKRFGRSAWLWGDEFDPGETYMEQVIKSIGGRYYPERDWKNRNSKEWVFEFVDWIP